MRIYRGLKSSYQPEAVGKEPGRFSGTDFTDCPLAALRYAHGRCGVVLVVDIPQTEGPRVTEELWLQEGPKRLMIWGLFDGFLVAQIPAKELRAQIRKRGVAAAADAQKSSLLVEYIDRRIGAHDAPD
jgi:hypothetical protein